MLLTQLRSAIDRLRTTAGIFVIDDGQSQSIADVVARHGATRLRQAEPGYGGALRTAFKTIDAEFIVTIECDGVHPPALLPYLFEMRHRADVVIASRYVRGGYAPMPVLRGAASRVLNAAFRRALDLPVRDLSSGFRLYRRDAVRALAIEQRSYAALQEILIKAYCEGYAVAEVPMHYRPGATGAWSARATLGVDYLRTFRAMWRLRNSVDSCDYDTRAFNSIIPPQRYWQRQRYNIITGFVGDARMVLDAGCGSTQIMNGRPQVIGIDPQRRKLRFMRAAGRRLVNASTFALPFASASFDVVISSQVIEHLPPDPEIFDELIRCLKPGGTLVLGTVDYGGWQWPLIEQAYALAKPTGYADEHITHYTRASLFDLLEKRGLRVIEHSYILGVEIIIRSEKPG
ncbi:MAG: methyltransferase domain-containing protein [Gammaproteobacteria bacterium]|nr:methyltransferase domain-containing protein [Gammaproteobacteria bacterium]